jgi:DME family drug/metabolite transporter
MGEQLANPFFALVPAVIWAVSPIYYKVFLRRFDFLSLNVVRTSLSAAVLFLPAVYFGFNGSVYYALLSGAVTLSVGDTFFLLSIREVGASVAAPVVYTYVLFVQVTASMIGEVVPFVNFVSAAMVILGVFVLSRGGGGRPRKRGVALALSGGIAWTIGQDLIGVATSAGGNVFAIAFARNLAGAIALGLALFLTGRYKNWPRLPRKEFAFVAFIAVSDLVVGSLAFVYSIALAGVALTVILTSVSPFLTQVLSRAMGKESPSRLDFAGGALIVAALVIAVAFR